jgi:molecular chaperone GrpE
MHHVPIHATESKMPDDASPAKEAPEVSTPGSEPGQEPAELQQELEMWRDRALRLQAEMENYRKRQRRLAEEQIAASREKTLQNLLEVADNLTRTLDAAHSSGGTDAASLRDGVEITLQSVRQALQRQDVHPIQAQGQPFDPTRHEAVSTVPRRSVNVPSHTVVEVLERGYRLGDRVLRPARVIVAV